MPERPYLRIGELAERTGVTPALLRAWERRYGVIAPARSEGGFRLYSDEDVERILRVREQIAAGVSAAQAAERVRREAATAAGPETGAHALLAAVLGLDDAAANRVLDAQLAVLSSEAVVNGVVVPVLQEIGERWQRGSVTVAEEHFASNLIRARLLGLARGWGRGIGPAVVLACVPGERHDIPLIVLGLGLRERGFRITFLGADTPVADVSPVVSRVGAVAVVVVGVTPGILEASARELRRLDLGRRLVLGGPDASSALAKRVGARLLDGDLADAADRLSGWLLEDVGADR